MTEFVVTPNFPRKRARLVLLSAEYPDIAKLLAQQGTQVLPVEPAGNLPTPIAAHADVNCLHLGGNRIAVNSAQTQLIRALETRGFDVLQVDDIGTSYPKDCALNALIGQGTSLSHRTALSGVVRVCLRERDFSFFYAKQGYVRCSTALVSGAAALTADKQIKGALTRMGYDCLAVPGGEIRLPGYDGGFLGGCCFKRDDATLAFTGRASALSYYPLISEFCRLRGVEIAELIDGPLTDVGGILPLLEEA